MRGNVPSPLSEAPLGVASPVKVAVRRGPGLHRRARAGLRRYLLILITVLAVMATHDDPIYPIVRRRAAVRLLRRALKLFFCLDLLLCVLAGLSSSRGSTPWPWRAAAARGRHGRRRRGALLRDGDDRDRGAGGARPAPHAPASGVPADGRHGGRVRGWRRLSRRERVRSTRRPRSIRPASSTNRSVPGRTRDGGRMLALMSSQALPDRPQLRCGASRPEQHGRSHAIPSGKGDQSTTPSDPVALARQIGGNPVVVGATSQQAGSSPPRGIRSSADGTLRLPRRPVGTGAARRPGATRQGGQENAAVEPPASLRARRPPRPDRGRRLPGGAAGDPAGRLQRVDRAPGLVRARVEVARPTWLVAREPYFRSWRRDDRRAPGADLSRGAFMMGVLVDGGSHDVRIEYRESAECQSGSRSRRSRRRRFSLAVRQVEPAT